MVMVLVLKDEEVTQSFVKWGEEREMVQKLEKSHVDSRSWDKWAKLTDSTEMDTVMESQSRFGQCGMQGIDF